jgi:hypothetical protein
LIPAAGETIRYQNRGEKMNKIIPMIAMAVLIIATTVAANDAFAQGAIGGF